MAVTSSKNIHLLIAFLIGAFFGPMVFGLVSGGVSKLGGRTAQG